MAVVVDCNRVERGILRIADSEVAVVVDCNRVERGILRIADSEVVVVVVVEEGESAIAFFNVFCTIY